MIDKELYEALENDEEFIKRITDAETLADVVALYKEKGIDVTEVELQDELDKQNTSGELQEENLEDVAGGTIIWRPRPFPCWPPIIPKSRTIW